MQEESRSGDNNGRQALLSLLNLSSESILIVDGEGCVLEFNPAAEKLFGFSREDVVGQDAASLLLGAPEAEGAAFFQQFLAGPGALDDDVPLNGRRADGSTFSLVLALEEVQGRESAHYIVVVRPLSEHNGPDYTRRLEQLLAQRSTQLLRAHEQVASLVRIDALTGLANAPWLAEYLRREWGRAERDGTQLSMVLAEVDCFDAFVEHYGEVAGDQALKQVARMLEAIFRRGGDLSARFDEGCFAVVLPGTDAEQLQINAERLVDYVRANAFPHTASTIASHLTVSVGAAALTPAMGGSPRELLDETRACLDRAIESGCDRAVVAED